MSEKKVIKLGMDGVEIGVGPSSWVDNGVALAMRDHRGERAPSATLSPAEWDDFAAAGYAAQGRAIPVPRAALESVIAEIDALEIADTDAILAIRRSLVDLLA